ncbi:MAG: DUF2202 domain-containing protein [Thermoleophilia bacterium]
MKSFKRPVALLAAALIVGVAAVGALLTNPAPAAAAQTRTVNATVAADLQHMREEEKLARDVYLVFDDLYGDQVAVFGKIAKSEAKHMLAIKRLLTYYGVADPVQKDVPGVFSDPDLQKLYDDLVDQGSTSLEDALDVGVAIETLDINDLEQAKSHTTVAKVIRVYNNLLRGSNNHLKAFTSVPTTCVNN